MRIKKTREDKRRKEHIKKDNNNNNDSNNNNVTILKSFDSSCNIQWYRDFLKFLNIYYSPFQTAMKTACP
jgi:hypothetical protein